MISVLVSVSISVFKANFNQNKMFQEKCRVCGPTCNTQYKLGFPDLELLLNESLYLYLAILIIVGLEKIYLEPFRKIYLEVLRV